MIYTYSDKNVNFFIETVQRHARESVIEQYIKCRKNKKMTQAELAEKVGMSRTNITRFESGTYNPTLDMLVKIAWALDMDLSIRLMEGKLLQTLHGGLNDGR